jgi:aminopeptidase
MTDPRMTKLADVLINYSTEVKPGEKILIEAIDVPADITCELVRMAHRAGAIPLVTIKNNEVLRTLLQCGTEEQIKLIADVEAHRMQEVQAYVGVRGNPNIAELSDVPEDKMKLYQSLWWKPVHGDIRVRKTRWVVLRYPSHSMAQGARMSTQAFEDFFFNVCTMDYRKMSKAMQPLKELMEKTDRVKLIGPDTELTFSIKGIPAVACDGKLNIPDGEVFTAPVRDSANGVISFNAQTAYQGVVHDNVRLELKDGKVTKATSSNPKHLNEALDTDEGARYVGEFALGVNPYITKPMLDTLFDEKIGGSFHFTPGSAYEDEADNGNRSAVHWDMVMLQTPENGGGEIWFDDVLIRKDGLFVLDQLKPLNPENLKG